MADSQDNPLKQLVTCFLCKGIYRDPKVLPCQHVFCEVCVGALTSENQVFCPTCQATCLPSDIKNDVRKETLITVYNTDTSGNQNIGGEKSPGPNYQVAPPTYPQVQAQNSGGKNSSGPSYQVAPPPYRQVQASSILPDLPPGKELTLLLVGKTGQGKSETGNTFFGKHPVAGQEFFPASDLTESCTTECRKRHQTVGGRQLTIVDTPGFKDTREKSVKIEIMAKTVLLNPDGYDAFLIVIKYPHKETREEVETLREIEETFGTIIFRYAVVLFTNGDVFQTTQEKNRRLGRPVESEEEYIKNIPSPVLQKLFKNVEQRVFFINNMDPNEANKRESVRKIVQVIDDLASIKKYDNEYFQEARRLVKSDTYRDLTKNTQSFLPKKDPPQARYRPPSRSPPQASMETYIKKKDASCVLL